MKISRIMFISKILTVSCAIRQKIINTFANIAFNVLVVKKFCKNIKKFI